MSAWRYRSLHESTTTDSYIPVLVILTNVSALGIRYLSADLRYLVYLAQTWLAAGFGGVAPCLADLYDGYRHA